MDIRNFFKKASTVAKKSSPPKPKTIATNIDLSLSDDEAQIAATSPSKSKLATKHQSPKHQEVIEVEDSSPTKPSPNKTGKKQSSKLTDSRTKKTTSIQPSDTSGIHLDSNGFIESIDEAFSSPEKGKRAPVSSESSTIQSKKRPREELTSSHKSQKSSTSPKKSSPVKQIKHQSLEDEIDEILLTPPATKRAKLDKKSPPKPVPESSPTASPRLSTLEHSSKRASPKSTPTKKSKAKDETPSLARQLSSPDKLASLNIKTLDPDHVSVGHAGYLPFLYRGGPEHHGQVQKPEGTPDCLEGFVFVITGVLDSLERDEATELIVKCGGTVSKTLGKKVTHALVGREAGPSKMAQIKERNIPALDEQGLFQLIEKLSNKSVKMDTEQPVTKSTETSKSSAHVSTTSEPTTAAGAKTRVSPQKKQAPTQLTVTLPSPVNPRISTLWTDKYKPIHSSDLVGNPGNVQKLLEWLKNWEQNYQNEKQASSTTSKTGLTKSRSNLGSFQRAILLVGSPGIGKTCAALIAAKECGYTPVHLNASDQRSKSTLKERVEELLSNRGITEFFGSKKMLSFSSSKTAGDSGGLSKTVLIMDEIDGMSSGDRGGLAELNLMIKSTKVPIIALANDRYKVKTLAGSPFVLCLSFSKPTVAQVYNRIASIAANEGLSAIPENNLRRIIESCQGDLRMTLNCLQMISNEPGSFASDSSSNGNLVEKSLKNTSKDVTLGPFDVVPKLFAPTVSPSGKPLTSFADRLEYYFVDYSFVPLFIQQNYLKTKIKGGGGRYGTQVPSHVPMDRESQRNQLNDLKSISRAAQSMAEGDLIGNRIFSSQNWSLLPVHGVVSTLLPTAILNGSAGMIEFPSSILSKGAKARKRGELLQELHAEMYGATGGMDSRALIDYLPHLARAMTEPLKLKGQEGITDVINYMDLYSISKEGRDSVLELCEWKWDKQILHDYTADIPTAVKTAFTRTYNAGSHMVVAKRSKKKATPDEAEDVEAILGAEESQLNEEEEEADNPENDSLISKVKQKKPKSTAAKGAKSESSKTGKKSK